jgi:ubiquinone/menaquinone biosynthesis C-methylase UbiE
MSQALHPMLARQSREESDRHNFLIALKTALVTGDLVDGNRQVYERRARARFENEKNREPQHRREVGSVMRDEPYYQMWSALGRIQQELYLDSTAECVERQLPELRERYRQYAKAPQHGSLRLDPDLEIPRYIATVDTHCVPGGYFAELGPDDVYVGARYDIGTFIFRRGQGGPMNDERGSTGVAFLKSRYPDLRPKRILDMGCGAGMDTLPYATAWPEAEVHGVEVSAPALRYAHARAEGLGVPVHFSQQDAEKMDFQDGSFDLIVSHILFHESSRRAIYNFLKECRRLLRPGGVMLHLDVPRRITAKTPFDQFMADWDTFNNNEPFWGTFLFDIDMEQPLREAGFDPSQVEETIAPAPSGVISYWAMHARV